MMMTTLHDLSSSLSTSNSLGAKLQAIFKKHDDDKSNHLLKKKLSPTKFSTNMILSIPKTLQGYTLNRKTL
ncbi:hypothetical protein HanRHA438_Chr09g0393361 [Helianthus annuus]|nr:hypothetical protein HanRHA438_Chr09g0393361 [Helianthus annuus]